MPLGTITLNSKAFDEKYLARVPKYRTTREARDRNLRRFSKTLPAMQRQYIIDLNKITAGSYLQSFSISRRLPAYAESTNGKKWWRSSASCWFAARRTFQPAAEGSLETQILQASKLINANYHAGLRPLLLLKITSEIESADLYAPRIVREKCTALQPLNRAPPRRSAMRPIRSSTGCMAWKTESSSHRPGHGREVDNAQSTGRSCGCLDDQARGEVRCVTQRS